MIAVLLGLVAVGLSIFYPITLYLLPGLFGVADAKVFIQSIDMQVQNPLALLFAQVSISTVGTFLFPAVFFFVIFRNDMRGTISLARLPTARQWLLAAGIMFASILFSQFLVQVMTAIPLSGQWAELRSTEHNGEKMMDAFFSDKGVGRFSLLVLCLGLLPAVAEELFFRATVQNLLMKTNLGAMWSIVFAGGLFSLFHLEFNNMLAIWCMGIVLGMLYYYTGSIWTSIAFHFFNNLLVVAGRFAYMQGYLHTDIVNSNDALPVYLTLPAGVLMIYGLITLKRQYESKMEW